MSKIKIKNNPVQKTDNPDSNMVQSIILQCDPSNEISKKILAQCVLNHTGSNRNDCNVFLKAVAKNFFGDSIFSGLDANGILAAVKSTGSGWTIKTGVGSINEAIKAAQEGKFVGAGMTSTELNDPDHGHIAIIVGCDGQMSGNKIVPIGYAGSLNSSAIIAGARLSGTFPATKVRNEDVTYFFREPTQTPDLSAFGSLLAATSTPLDDASTEERLSLLREAASVMEIMFEQLKPINEKKKTAKMLGKPSSLRVKVGDIELEATFS